MSPFSAHTAEIRRLVSLWEPKLLALPAANLGNNDRWIALQDYQHSPWPDLVSLFTSTTLHFAHVADRVDESKLGNVWLNALSDPITLGEMIRDYGRSI